LPIEEIPLSPGEAWDQIRNRFSLDPQSQLFGLSIDLDAFAQNVCPGVSAPQAFGIDPRLVLKLIDHMALSIQHLGIYELCPRHDRDGATSRMAARLIQSYLSSRSA
jgi:formiminoglutamase